MSFLAAKNMVLMKYPKILTGVLLEILIQCRPNIFVRFKKKPKISTSHTDNVFLVSKTWFLRNTPRFRQVLILFFFFFFLIQCRPSVFALFKKPKILTSKSWPWVFGVKKHGSYEILQDFDTC